MKCVSLRIENNNSKYKQSASFYQQYTDIYEQQGELAIENQTVAMKDL